MGDWGSATRSSQGGGSAVSRVHNKRDGYGLIDFDSYQRVARLAGVLRALEQRHALRVVCPIDDRIKPGAGHGT